MNGDASLMKEHFRAIAKKTDHPGIKLRPGP
jgi:hypothetical protein